METITQREGIERLDPRSIFEVNALRRLVIGRSQLADGTPLVYKGVSAKPGRTIIEGRILLFAIAPAGKAPRIPYREIREARWSEYAVLLREPTAEELSAWREKNPHLDLAPTTAELLVLRFAWQDQNVFARTAISETWAERPVRHRTNGA